MKAYKVFDKNWKCRDFQYEVGKTYSIEEKPVLCELGFHACKNLSSCFSYYDFNCQNKVAEVELIGDIVGLDENKQCTNKIKIVKELTWEEVLKLCNSGHSNSGHSNSGNYNSGNYNSGYRNSGDFNSGNYNSGDFNSGDRNSGNFNSGDRNSGNYNSGYRNSGNYNSGYRNSGNFNSGDRNSGNFNSGDRNSGNFNTNEPFVRMFNKQTKKRYSEIDFPSFLFFDLIQFVSYDTASEEERLKYKKEIEIYGGFLKTLDYKTAFMRAWKNASKEDRVKILKLPNFNKKIFFEISGIDVDKD